MAGDRTVLMGLLLYILVAATPTLMVWVAVRWLPPAVCWVTDRFTPRRTPPRPCLESVVGNLRRLRREVRCRAPSQTRRVALLAAYDETLLQACTLVGVEAALVDAPASDRHFARLLTEAQLEEAGVALDPPSSANAA